MLKEKMKIMISEETKQRALVGKSEREKLELNVHWALIELSEFFKKSDNPLMFRVNKSLRELDRIRAER